MSKLSIKDILSKNWIKFPVISGSSSMDIWGDGVPSDGNIYGIKDGQWTKVSDSVLVPLQVITDLANSEEDKTSQILEVVGGSDKFSNIIDRLKSGSQLVFFNDQSSITANYTIQDNVITGSFGGKNSEDNSDLSFSISFSSDYSNINVISTELITPIKDDNISYAIKNGQYSEVQGGGKSYDLSRIMAMLITLELLGSDLKDTVDSGGLEALTEEYLEEKFPGDENLGLRNRLSEERDYCINFLMDLPNMSDILPSVTLYYDYLEAYKKAYMIYSGVEEGIEENEVPLRYIPFTNIFKISLSQTEEESGKTYKAIQIMAISESEIILESDIIIMLGYMYDVESGSKITSIISMDIDGASSDNVVIKNNNYNQGTYKVKADGSRSNNFYLTNIPEDGYPIPGEFLNLSDSSDSSSIENVFSTSYSLYFGGSSSPSSFDLLSLITQYSNETNFYIKKDNSYYKRIPVLVTVNSYSSPRDVEFYYTINDIDYKVSIVVTDGVYKCTKVSRSKYPIKISVSEPTSSDGIDGDIWIQYTD